MIDLTPLDVRKKKGDLPRALRGYEASRVDDFLDLVAERLEELVRQNMYLTERLEQLETQLREYRERERSLSDALMSAQELRESARQQALKDAELVKREAELEAARIRSAAEGATRAERDAIRRLRAERKQLLTGFRSALERQMSELDVMLQTLGLEADAALPESPVGPTIELDVGPEAPSGPGDDAGRREAGTGETSDAAAAGGESKAAGDEGDQSNEADWLSSILEEERP